MLFAARSAVAGAPPLHIGYDVDHLDLDKHVLQFKPSRAVDSATLSVIGEDGKEIGTGSATFGADSGDKWQAITWTQPADAHVLQLVLEVAYADGKTKLKLTPWSATVEHEDVNFRTDLAVIDPDETKKLDASYAKIDEIVKRVGKYMKPQLYVAGHTDTVGPSAKNRKLSNARALAIAQYFRKKGLAIPITVAGFGEDVLKVQTPDETDERANRRADYVLGPAGGTPPFRGAYSKVKADWKQIK